MIRVHRKELRFKPHQAGWAAAFDRYKTRLLGAFLNPDVRIMHIGSTAVAGLLAIPIIDIAVSIPVEISNADCRRLLIQAGFQLCEDPNRGRAFVFVDEIAPGVQACHIYVYRPNDPEWEATLCFRDTLRRDPMVRTEYQRLKQHSVQQGLSHHDYQAAKSGFTNVRSCVLQARIPDDHAIARNQILPGVQPLTFSSWLKTDDAFDGQMALRDRLISSQRQDVLQQSNDSKPAALELLEMVLQQLSDTPGYCVAVENIRRPDGVAVEIDKDDPLATAGRLIQEDLCLLERRQGEHVLTGAVLCFPASWSLADKFMKPLTLIHAPVSEYNDDIGKRVQRMFDLMRSEQPLWRSNVLFYEHPMLFSPFVKPRTSGKDKHTGGFVRSERQSLIKLPKTGAVVFSIHTYLMRFANLTAIERLALIQ